MKSKRIICVLIALFMTNVFVACKPGGNPRVLANPAEYSFVTGDFLSLKTAYEIGLLEKVDLEIINLNRYSVTDNRFDEIQTVLVNGWTSYLTENYDYIGTSDGVSVREFCGLYKGLAVIMMSDPVLGYDQALSQETIGDTVFSYNDGQTLFACVVETNSLLWNRTWNSVSWYGENADFVEPGYERLVLEDNISSWYVGYHDGWAYIMDGNGISRVRPDGSGKQSMGIRYFTEAMIHDGWLYYVEGAYNMYTNISQDTLFIIINFIS